MSLAPSRSDLGESLLITTLLGIPLEEPDGKTPTAGADRGALAKDRQKNSMAFLDDNPVLEKGTSFRVGSWIFTADGSGSFESCPTDQDLPEVPEATKRRELDDFADRLEEVGFSNLNNEARIQSKFDAIKAKTLSELEEDLEELLEESKQETSTNGKNTLSNRIHVAEPSLRKKSQRLASRKLLAKRTSRKTLFQTSMILMKRSSTAS